uniref:uncharacterized protein LOC122601137 n=1 Tax=Erigeron canadensis TaxID=72917 RepID=UPI001CB8DC71|nr:uncharacterized protein LOC122601137 [Erigeron canadensis]
MASSSSSTSYANNSNNNESSSKSGFRHPAPVSDVKLPPYVVGSEVVVSPADLDTGIYLDFCRQRDREQHQESQASLATPSTTISKSTSKRPIVEDLVPLNVAKKKRTKRIASASEVDKTITIRLKVPQGALEVEERSKVDSATQADKLDSPRPSALSQKSVDELKGTTTSVQPSKQGEGIETKTSSQGHTMSPPNSPSSASQKVDDTIKGTTVDPAQIQIESESMHITPEDDQPKDASIERLSDTACIPQAGQTPSLLHSESTQAASTLNITPAGIDTGLNNSPSGYFGFVSASVLGQRDPISYTALFREVMLSPCTTKGTIDGPHDVNENIVTISGSDSLFDDVFAHPSSRDALMEDANGGVDQNHNQQIPTGPQSELQVNPSQIVQHIITSERSAHETHSHEKIHQNCLSLHPLLYEPNDPDFKECRLLFLKSVAFRPTASSSQAATISSLDMIQKDQELTDKKVEKLCQDHKETEERVIKALENMEKSQSKLTESLDRLTKAMIEQNELNKSTLGQIEKNATKFTRDVSIELKNSNKSQTEFKKELVDISKGVQSNMDNLHNDFIDLHRSWSANNFRIDMLNTRLSGIFTTPVSSFPPDDDKKGEEKRSERSEAEIEQERIAVEKETAEYLKKLDARYAKSRREREANDRRMVVYGSNPNVEAEEEIKRPESESGGIRIEEVNEEAVKESDNIEGETTDVVMDFVGEIRKEYGEEESADKGKSSQSVSAQADPAAKIVEANSTSSDDTTTLSQFMMKKRESGEGSSGVKVLTQEEQDWEFAAEKAQEMNVSIKDAYKMIMEDRLERLKLTTLEYDRELARALQKTLNKEDEEVLPVVGAKRKAADRKEKRKVVVHSKPSQKVKDVRESSKAHAGWEAVDIKKT